MEEDWEDDNDPEDMVEVGEEEEEWDMGEEDPRGEPKTWKSLFQRYEF